MNEFSYFIYLLILFLFKSIVNLVLNHYRYSPLILRTLKKKYLFIYLYFFFLNKFYKHVNRIKRNLILNRNQIL